VAGDLAGAVDAAHPLADHGEPAVDQKGEV
jgi:hypothetical protein